MADTADLETAHRSGPDPAPVGRRPATGLTAFLDGVTDFAVVAFALWTLLYDAGLLFKLGTSVLLLLWVAGLAAGGAALIWLRRVVNPAAVAGEADAESPVAPRTPRPVRYLGAAGAALGLAAAVAAGLHRYGLAWTWTWLLGALAVLATATAVITRNAGHGTAEWARYRQTAPNEMGSLLALCTAVGAAIFSLYVVRPDGDDAYFISRSVWTAEHGRIPVRDVIFTNQAVGGGNGEPPVASIEVLNGALARVLGVHAASFTYYIWLPVATFFAVWATWLLVRRWAPRRQALCFGVAMIYLLWGGVSGASFGGFHLARMWQGKAAFVSIMVPLLYAYLTRWAEQPSRRALVLVLAASVAGIGLTSTAVMIVPIITAAAMAPLLLAGRVRTAATAGLALVYPLVAGFAVAVLYPVRGSAALSAGVPPATVWSGVMLSGVLGAVSGVGLWLSPWLARRGVPALITTGIAAAATVMLVPGAIAFISRATGAGVVSWRLLWLVPGPVLVGLLAAVPLPVPGRAMRLPPAARRAAGAVARRLAPVLSVAPAAAVAALILVYGVPIWSYQSAHTTVARHPSWKYDALSLALARAAIRADHRPGYLLSTQRIMGAIPLITTRIHAVDPRDLYLSPSGLPVGRDFVEPRRLLTRMAGGVQPMPSPTAVRTALARVDVGFACVWRVNTGAVSLLLQVGYRNVTHFRSLECFAPG